MTRVNLKDLTKNFGEVLAVDHVNLEIREGEFFTLLGPSGSGKSTLLRLIAGLEEPTEGEIYFGDELVNDKTPRDRNVALVFQSYALYPNMSVYKNIGFPLKLKKIPKEQIRKRVLSVAEMINIDELLDRKPRQLSGGQQQRVAVARALVREPSLFLLDEPLSNLDAKLRVKMRSELKRIHSKLKVTTIYVTHDQVEAMSMSDRIAIMNFGEVYQIGHGESLYEKPANIFVGGFLGIPPMNFLDADLIEEKGKIFLVIAPSEEHSFPLNVPQDVKDVVKSSGSTELIIGIRPEYVTLTRKKVENSISAEISLTEVLGREQIVHINRGGTELKAIANPNVRYEIGGKINFKFDESKIQIFDKKTNKAII